MKSSVLSIAVILFSLSSCGERKLDKGVIHSEIAPIHKDLYEINHNLMTKLINGSVTPTDSTFLDLCKYIDVVVIELINGSGGLDASNGDVINPGDQKLWIKVMEEIEFNKNWNTGINKIEHKSGADKLLDYGLANVETAKDKRLRLDLVCVEMRILQLKIINLWMQHGHYAPLK